MKLSVVVMAPGMLMKPEPVLTCHCTVWSPALLVAAAVKVTGEPEQMVCEIGSVETTGSVSTVSVAKAVLVEPQASVKTARYFLPLSPATVAKLSVVEVAPGMLLKPEPVSTCHCTVWSEAFEVAAAVKVAVPAGQTVWVTGLAVT